MSEAKTDKMTVRFRVKEGVGGTTFVTAEALEGELSLLAPVKGFLTLELPPGTAYEGAETIIKFLNDNIAAICCTYFPHG
jgi:hypothetical protein